MSNMDISFITKIYQCINYIAKYVTKPEVISNDFAKYQRIFREIKYFDLMD